jgi:hypothetical protein
MIALFRLSADIWQPLGFPSNAPPTWLALYLVNAAKATVELRLYIQRFSQC